MPRHSRSLVALVCVAALLAVAMAPIAGVSYCAILVPIEPIFGVIVSAPVERIDERCSYAEPAAAPLPSRAPPAA